MLHFFYRGNTVTWPHDRPQELSNYSHCNTTGLHIKPRNRRLIGSDDRQIGQFIRLINTCQARQRDCIKFNAPTCEFQLLGCMNAHNIRNERQLLTAGRADFRGTDRGATSGPSHNRNIIHKFYWYIWLYSPLLGLGPFFSFLIFYTDGRTPWTGNQPVARPLPAHRTTQT
jgi:hypothetical protein